MKRVLAIYLLIVFLSACGKVNRDRLDKVIEESKVSTQTMVAIGGGSEFDYFGDLKYPVYVHFYQAGGANNYRFFETKDMSADPADFSAYIEVKKAPIQGIFDGSIQQLKLKESHSRWGIMTYNLGDSLRLSDPIRINAIDRPSQSLASWLEIDEDILTPTFSWQDGSFQESTNYWLVVADESGQVISTGILDEKAWQFYNASALDENLLTSPLPVLIYGQTYQFQVMGFNSNNWMNTSVSATFSAI